MFEYVFELASLRFYQHRLVTQDFQFDPELKSEAVSFVQEITRNFQRKRYFQWLSVPTACLNCSAKNTLTIT
jgi:hypothetical protein